MHVLRWQDKYIQRNLTSDRIFLLYHNEERSMIKMSPNHTKKACGIFYFKKDVKIFELILIRFLILKFLNLKFYQGFNLILF